jgi:hypothetical protein
MIHGACVGGAARRAWERAVYRRRRHVFGLAAARCVFGKWIKGRGEPIDLVQRHFGTTTTAMPNRSAYKATSRLTDNYRSTRADATEVMSALSRQQLQDGEPLVERRHIRRTWVITLDIQVEERSVARIRTRDLRVITRDLSRGGFSFTFGYLIHPGSLVRVRFDTLPGKPVLTGTVRHCHHEHGTEHHIGVQFD